MGVYLRESDIVSKDENYIYFSVTQLFDGLYGGAQTYTINYKIPHKFIIIKSLFKSEYGNLAISTENSLNLVKEINKRVNKDRIHILGKDIFDLYILDELTRNYKSISGKFFHNWAREY